MNINSFKSFYLVGRLLLIFTVLNFSSFIFCSLPSRDAEHATQEAVSALNSKNLESFNRAIDALIKIVEVPGSGGEHAVRIRFLEIIRLLKNFEWDRSNFLAALKKLGKELVNRKIVTPEELKNLENSVIPQGDVKPIVEPVVSKPDPVVIPAPYVSPLPDPVIDPVQDKHGLSLKKASVFLIAVALLALGISNKEWLVSWFYSYGDNGGGQEGEVPPDSGGDGGEQGYVQEAGVKFDDFQAGKTTAEQAEKDLEQIRAKHGRTVSARPVPSKTDVRDVDYNPSEGGGETGRSEQQNLQRGQQQTFSPKTMAWVKKYI